MTRKKVNFENGSSNEYQNEKASSSIENEKDIIDDIESDESVHNSENESDTDDYISKKTYASLNKSLNAIKQLRASVSSPNIKGKPSTTTTSTTTNTQSPSINILTTNELQIQQQKKKILYTLWLVDPEWIDEQQPTDEELENEEYYNHYLSRRKKLMRQSVALFNFLMRLPLQSIQLLRRSKPRQSKLSPLHIHNIRQPNAKLLVSNDGSILVNTQNASLVFRSSNDNFSSIQKRWNYFQIDKESQWQRLSFSPDNSLVAFSTSGCTIYIISIQGENTVNILSPNMLGLNPKDGIVDLAIRNSICSLSNSSLVKCFELLVLGYDMILRRFHIPMLNQEFTIHPVNSNDPTLSNGCYPQTSPIDMKGVHHEIGCMDYCQSTDILAVGGNRKSKKSSKGGSSIKPYVSFWKLSDEEPYFRLLNKPPASGIDFDSSVDGLNASGSNINNSEQQQQHQQKGFTVKLWNKLQKSIYGDYFPGIILHKIIFSNDGTQIIGLDLNGTITLWNTPSSSSLSSTSKLSSSASSAPTTNIKPVKIWHTNDLLNIWDKSNRSNPLTKNVIDISWWSNDQIIAANRGGEIVIFSMLNNENCLLHDQEMVSSTQPPILTRSHNGRFFILETSGSIQRKPTVLAITQDYLNEKVGKPSIAVYKYIYRYFYGDHPDDQDPFDYTIHRNDQQGSSGSSAVVSSNSNNNADGHVNQANKLSKGLEEHHIERRIIRFQSTKPEQLFKAKVAQKEYNNAIIIAEHYGLDKDLVHQKRWSKTPVSIDSIKSYLSKVHDINWIMWECHTRIPLNYDSTKLLLEYALEKSSKIINENSPIDILKEHKSLLVHRNIVINYLNRLAVYKEIYGTSFDAFDFLRFRGCNLILIAMEFANSEHFKAIDVLFTYYSKELLAYRLQILSMIPETTDANQYVKLLPDFNNYWTPKKVFEQDWSQSHSIYKNVLDGFDYEKRTDSNYLKDMLTNVLKSDYEDIRGRDKVNDIYSLDYMQLPFDETTLISTDNKGTLSTDDISQWYQERAEEIGRKSGQIDNALQFISLGIEKEVPNLEDLQHLIKQVSIVIYHTNADVWLDSYKSLSPQEKLALLLNDSSYHTIYNNIRNRLDSFREQHHEEFDDLLEMYFVSKAKTGHIGLVRYYLDTLKQNKPDQCGTASTLSIGLNSIANVQLITSDSIAHMEAIIEALPERGVVGGLSSVTQRLLNLRSDYSRYIQANKILLKYTTLSKPISYFQEAKENVDESANALLLELCRYAKKNQWKNANYRSMFTDFLQIKQLVLYDADLSTLYCQFVKMILSEGKFSLSKEYFDGCGPEKVEQLVISAAKELFNSASSFNSPNIAEAKLCLELIKPPTQKIVRELNLIKATEIMTSRFHYPKIPLQIRLILDKGLSKTSPRVNQSRAAAPSSSMSSSTGISNEPFTETTAMFGENQGRFELIQSLIDSCPNSYQDIEEVLNLSSLLCDWIDVSEDHDDEIPFVDDHIIVEVMLARKAIEMSDYPVAFKICKKLMSEPKKKIPSQYKEIYRVCSRLAIHGQFHGLQPRLDLLSYCLMYCDQEDLTGFLEAYQELELRNSLIDSSTNFESSSTLSQLKSSADDDHVGGRHRIKVLDKMIKDEEELIQRIKELKQDQPELILEPPYTESQQSLASLLSSDNDSGNNNTELEIDSQQLYIQQNELMLHLSQLIQSIEFDPVKRYESTQQILLLLSKYSLQQGDLKRSLSYFFVIRDQNTVDQIFNHLIESSQNNSHYQTSLERVIRLACYYYSLRLLSFVAAKTPNEMQNSICSLLNISIDAIINSANSLSEIPGDSEEERLLSGHIQRYHKMLIDSIQVKEFSEVDNNVDFHRFKEDPAYKRDTIFQFAMSNDPKSFQTAFSMASRYGITRQEVLEKHVEWKIMVDGSNFNNTLLSADDISILSATEHQLILDIYDKIDGCDYEKLLLFYDLIGKFDPNNHHIQSKIKHKKKLLTLLKSPKNTINKIFKPLNFKRLIEDTSYDPYVEGIRHQLSEDNIAFCCNLINILQNIRGDMDLIQNYTVSKMYKQLILNIVKDKSEDLVDVVLKYRKQLDDNDLLEVYEMISYGDFSERLSMDERIDALNQIINTDQVGENPDLDDKFKLLLRHLEVIKKLHQLEPKINLSEYDIIKQYNQALIDAYKYNTDIDQVNTDQLAYIIPTLIKMCKQISPSQCEQIYRIIKGNDSSDSISAILNYYQSSFLIILREFRQSFDDHITHMLLLETIKRIIDSFKSGTKWHSEQKIFLKPLRDFAYDTQNPMECRIKIFEILKNTPSLYDKSHQEWLEEDLTQMKQHKTKEIIKETWKNADISFSDMEITTPESSIPLFDRLIDNSNSFHHISYLSELLTMWSNAKTIGSEDSNEIHVLHHCWFKLFIQFIPYFKDNTKAINQFLRLRLDQIKQYPMEMSEEMEIIEHLKKSDMITYFKFGLLSCYRNIQLSTTESLLIYLTELDPSTSDTDNSIVSYCSHQDIKECKKEIQQFIQQNQQLLQIIFSSGFTYKFIDTQLFGPLVNLITLYNNNFNNVNNYQQRDVDTSIEYSIAMLAINRNYYQAANLCLWWLGVHPIMHSLNNAMAYLQHYVKVTSKSIGKYLKSTGVDIGEAYVLDETSKPSWKSVYHTLNQITLQMKK